MLGRGSQGRPGDEIRSWQAGRGGRVGLSKQFGFRPEPSRKPREGFQEGGTGADLRFVKRSLVALWGMDSRRASREAEQDLLSKA